MRQLWLKVLRALIMTRFIPVETLMAIVSILLGIGFFVGTAFGLAELPIGPASYAFSVWLVLVGGLELFGLSQQEGSFLRMKLRKFGAFSSAMNFMFVSIVLLTNRGFWTPSWVGWLAVSLNAGIAYLSLVLEELLWTEELIDEEIEEGRE